MVAPHELFNLSAADAWDGRRRMPLLLLLLLMVMMVMMVRMTGVCSQSCRKGVMRLCALNTTEMGSLVMPEYDLPSRQTPVNLLDARESGGRG